MLFEPIFLTLYTLKPPWARLRNAIKLHYADWRRRRIVRSPIIMCFVLPLVFGGFGDFACVSAPLFVRSPSGEWRSAAAPSKFPPPNERNTARNERTELATIARSTEGAGGGRKGEYQCESKDDGDVGRATQKAKREGDRIRRRGEEEDRNSERADDDRPKIAPAISLIALCRRGRRRYLCRTRHGTTDLTRLRGTDVCPSKAFERL